MIKTKVDYKQYLTQDFKANNIPLSNGSITFAIKNFLRRLLNPNPIEEFIRRLRRAEYYNNCPPPQHFS